MKLLIIDNYDSFTYNLVQIIRESELCTYKIVRNDRFELNQVDTFDKILISPGPGVPENAGLTKSVIEHYGSTKSILGVCLGHQAIAEVYGNKLENLTEVKHGISSTISIDTSDYLFENMNQAIEVGRYHSWVVSNQNPLNNLVVTATDEEGQIMALKHTHHDVRGVQFHPESILTPEGKTIIENFLRH